MENLSGGAWHSIQTGCRKRQPRSAARPPGVAGLFVGFLLIGVCGFGGVLPWARRMIVEQRRWMTPAEFTDLLGLCQFLPGGNIMNFSIGLGARFHGPLGAVAASLIGLMSAPVAIVLVLGLVYDRYSGLPTVRHGFAGLAAAASALVLANALKIAAPLRGRPLGLAMAAADLRGDRRAAPAAAAGPAGAGGGFHAVAVAVRPVSVLASLAAVFGTLSLLAFGGTNSVLPEMQRQVVAVHGWLTPQQFASLFALAQAAPGPNMLVVTLIGWRVASLPGALVATLAVTTPSSLLMLLPGMSGTASVAARWRQAVQQGLMPVTAGLVMASAALLIRTTATDWRTAAVVVVATVVLLFTRVHPLIVLGAAAAWGRAGC